MTDTTSTCAACGGTDFEDGHLVFNGPVRFKTPDQGSFRKGAKVAARACKSCRHVALYLEE